jgi:Glyoxalase-like domain
MGSRLTEIVVDCRDPVAQAAFWAAALGYHVVRSEDRQVEIAPWRREPPDLAEQVRQAPGVPTLVFVPVPEAKTVKNRLHLDLRPVGLPHAAEAERLIGLGPVAPTSGRARSPGRCWPTRRATSSASWVRSTSSPSSPAQPLPPFSSVVRDSWT